VTAPLAVIAIGGNALIADAEHQAIPDQAREVERACEGIARLVQRGWRVVVTHGNGPQVGYILRRSEIASGEVAPVPMEYATADTQGAIGFMFQKAFAASFRRLGLARQALAVVTQVLVDRADPSFQAPAKPIGPFFTEARGKELAVRLGWSLIEDSGRGWRRVVPSPLPLSILELPLIGDLLAKDRVVVCCGGGGIPVAWTAEGRLEGLEAVIDKDRSSALLARALAADAFVLCTSVSAVYTGFGTPAQRRLDTVPALEARALLQRGEFGAGSMGPKVEAALDFLAGNANPGARAVIGSLEDLVGLAEGARGTRLVP
jgi:carbamate kinase